MSRWLSEGWWLEGASSLRILAAGGGAWARLDGAPQRLRWDWRRQDAPQLAEELQRVYGPALGGVARFGMALPDLWAPNGYGPLEPQASFDAYRSQGLDSVLGPLGLEPSLLCFRSQVLARPGAGALRLHAHGDGLSLQLASAQGEALLFREAPAQNGRSHGPALRRLLAEASVWAQSHSDQAPRHAELSGLASLRRAAEAALRRMGLAVQVEGLFSEQALVAAELEALI